MGIFKEIPPTAGFALGVRNLLSVFSRQARQGCLEEDFKNYLGVPYARITNSGTAALYIILEALKELSPKKSVVIPSFVCPLVPLAIHKAGLEVKVCDINKENFDFNKDELAALCAQNSDILAIVPVHLAGIPADLEALSIITSKDKIFVIEDCAQALGALYKGKRIGAFGDFSFFSLCRGKGLTIYEGGAIVTQKGEYATLLDKKMQELVRRDYFSEALRLFEFLGYALFYRPQLFWFAYRMPQIFWERQSKLLKAAGEYFPLDFPVHSVSGIRKLFGHVTFGRLEKEIDGQRRRVLDYLEGLKDLKGARCITEPGGTKASYPYLTLLFEDPQRRNAALKIFRDSGLGVSQVYVAAITDYGYLKGIVGDKVCPNARHLASRQLTLSTSAFLKRKDLAAIIKRIKNT